jgi:hypothetical protein
VPVKGVRIPPPHTHTHPSFLKTPPIGRGISLVLPSPLSLKGSAETWSVYLNGCELRPKSVRILGDNSSYFSVFRLATFDHLFELCPNV